MIDEVDPKESVEMKKASANNGTIIYELNPNFVSIEAQKNYARPYYHYLNNTTRYQNGNRAKNWIFANFSCFKMGSFNLTKF